MKANLLLSALNAIAKKGATRLVFQVQDGRVWLGAPGARFWTAAMVGTTSHPNRVVGACLSDVDFLVMQAKLAELGESEVTFAINGTELRIGSEPIITLYATAADMMPVVADSSGVVLCDERHLSLIGDKLYACAGDESGPYHGALFGEGRAYVSDGFLAVRVSGLPYHGEPFFCDIGMLRKAARLGGDLRVIVSESQVVLLANNLFQLGCPRTTLRNMELLDKLFNDEFVHPHKYELAALKRAVKEAARTMKKCRECDFYLTPSALESIIPGAPTPTTQRQALTSLGGDGELEASVSPLFIERILKAMSGEVITLDHNLKSKILRLSDDSGDIAALVTERIPSNLNYERAKRFVK